MYTNILGSANVMPIFVLHTYRTVNSYLCYMKEKKEPKKKQRAKEYEKKLKIEGTLDDVLKVSVPKKKGE